MDLSQGKRKRIDELGSWAREEEELGTNKEEEELDSLLRCAILPVLKREVRLFAERTGNHLRVRVENLEREVQEKDAENEKLKDLQESTKNLLLAKEREFGDMRNEHSDLLKHFYNLQESETETRVKSTALAATNAMLDQEIQSFQIATKNDLREKQDQNVQIELLKSTIQKVDKRNEILMTRKEGLKENLEAAEHTIRKNLLKLEETEKKISNLESLSGAKDLQLLDCKKRCRELETRGLSPDLRKVNSGYEQKRDLILLGMRPSSTETQVRDYFKDKADIAMVQVKNFIISFSNFNFEFAQVKKSKDNMSSFAFVKFTDKEVGKALCREKHLIDGKECTLRVQVANHQVERHLYVGYHDQTLSNDELREHFEQFGEVEEVYIPTPWRHFAFVTFTSAKVAQSLSGKEQTVRGVILQLKSRLPAAKGKKDGEQGDSRRGSIEREVWGRGRFRDRHLEDMAWRQRRGDSTSSIKKEERPGKKANPSLERNGEGSSLKERLGGKRGTFLGS